MFYPLNSTFRFAVVVFERSKFQKICQKIKILTLPRAIFICLKQLGEPLMHVPFPQPAQLIKPENSDLGRQFSRKIEYSLNDQKILVFYEGENFVKKLAEAAKTGQLPTTGSLH